MGATLADLPAELVCSLMNLLDNQDALTFRQTTRHIERSTFETFARRFFRKKGFLISPLALDVLQRIAKDAHLSRYVQHVWFNPDYFTFTQFETTTPTQIGDVFGYSISSTVKLDDQSYQAYSRGLEDHRELMRPDRLTPILCEAFRRFTNLQTVGMRRSEDHAAYGWSHLAQKIGHDPRLIGQSFNHMHGTMSRPGLLYIAMIQALAQADRRVQRLYTDAIELDHIEPNVMPPEVVRAACADLKYLEINTFFRFPVVASSEDARAPRQSRDEQEASEQLWAPGFTGGGLLQVLKATPRLQEVALQILPTVDASHLPSGVPAGTLRSLHALRLTHAHLVFADIVKGVQLSNLQRVKLERFTATGLELWSFLKSSADRLISLKLREVGLTRSDDDVRPWQAFFETLSARCPKLSTILFHDLLRKDGLSIQSVVLFEPPKSIPEPTDEEAGSQLDYIPGMHHALVKAAGIDQVATTLASISKGHWYHRLSLRIAELDDDWHTDTSDEDW